VNRKTKSTNFILSTIGRADIAPNIPTALSGAVKAEEITANIRLSGNSGGHLPTSSLSRYSSSVLRVDEWSDRVT
jgi:hypothetical protein